MLGLCFGVWLFASKADAFLPLATWQAPRFALIWLVALVWGFAVTGAGHVLLLRLLTRTLPVLEQLTLSFALGLIAFQLAVFLCGLAGFLSRPLFYVLPVAFLAVGALPLTRYLRRLARHMLGKPRRLSPSATLLAAFGVLGIGLMYVPIITPSHIGFDSGMYHVPIAEHYLAAGAIRRFADGWILGTYPQMASLIYTWALLAPGLDFLDRIVLLAHLEFVIFVVTLLGVSALARALLGPGRGRWAWVACFAFPCLFLHDLQLAADHLAALWFAPLYLCLFRAYKTLDWRFTSLTAACAAGALLTKYTAYPMVFLPAIAILARGLFLLVRPVVTRADIARGLMAALVTGLVLTAPHWLKNLIWYGDPFYPMLARHLDPRPWNPDAAIVTDVYLNQVGLNRPPRTWAGVGETLQALYDFSFKAYEFYEFHRDVPYFGSLFTVATFAVPFLRVSRRTWGLLLGLYVSLFVWYWLSHHDRYLQAFLPGMAAIVAVVFELCWRRGWLFRLPVVAAAGLQLTWGADVFAIPIQVERYQRSLSTIGATYNKGDKLRTAQLGSWFAVGKELPRNAVVLIHDAFWHLGLQRQSISDWVGLQGGLSYGRIASAAEIYDAFENLGVTHLAFGFTPMNDSSLGSELRFLDFAHRFGVGKHNVSGILVAAMPEQRPGPEAKDWVLVQACADPYEPGLYPFEQTNVPALRGLSLAPYPAPTEPLGNGNAVALVERATLAVTRNDRRCNDEALQLIREQMQEIGSRSGATLWTRPKRRAP